MSLLRTGSRTVFYKFHLCKTNTELFGGDAITRSFKSVFLVMVRRQEATWTQNPKSTQSSVTYSLDRHSVVHVVFTVSVTPQPDLLYNCCDVCLHQPPPSIVCYYLWRLLYSLRSDALVQFLGYWNSVDLLRPDLWFTSVLQSLRVLNKVSVDKEVRVSVFVD